MPSEAFRAYQQTIASTHESPGWDDPAAWRIRIDGAMGPQPLAGVTTAQWVSAGGVDAILQERDEGGDDALVVYFHGGGYAVCSAVAYRAYCSHLVQRAGVRVLNVDYRRAPEHPFPAAVEDAVAAVSWALAREAPSRVVLAGDSAGGGLAVAALVALRDRGLPLPAGGVCLSPWVDLTLSAASYASRAETDTMLSLPSAIAAAGHYLQGQDPRHPLASPVFADLTALPPLLVLVGEAEVLHHDAQALSERAVAAGVDAELFVYPHMPHVWMLPYPAYPEAAMAFDQIGAFVARVTRGAAVADARTPAPAEALA